MALSLLGGGGGAYKYSYNWVRSTPNLELGLVRVGVEV